jgi:hypothetical protein
MKEDARLKNAAGTNPSDGSQPITNNVEQTVASSDDTDTSQTTSKSIEHHKKAKNGWMSPINSMLSRYSKIDLNTREAEKVVFSKLSTWKVLSLLIGRKVSVLNKVIRTIPGETYILAVVCTLVFLISFWHAMGAKELLLLLASLGLLYALLHVILGIGELRTISRVFSLTAGNRPRIPFILLGVSSAMIVVMQVFKEQMNRDFGLTSGIVDGVTGVAASLVAAALYQVLEMWRTYRERYDNRKQLLYLLGIDEHEFGFDGKISIVLPDYGLIYSQDDGEVNVQVSEGKVAEIIGARNRLGLGIERLCAVEDIKAFRRITQMFQDREIKWDLKHPKDFITDDSFDKKMDEKAFKQWMDELEGHYVCIGLYSNLLTMVSNYCEMHDNDEGLAFIQPMTTSSDNAAIIVRKATLQATSYTPLGKSNNAESEVVTDGEKAVLWDQKRRAWLSPPGQNADCSFYFRRFNRKSSIFILGGLTAKGTDKCSEYFELYWERIIKELESKCELVGYDPHSCKFAHIVQIDLSVQDTTTYKKSNVLDPFLV